MASSKATNINYVENYFQIKTLSKIHGEPNFDTLRTLRNQIKANAGSVVTHLGGGGLGYLGLLLPAAEYARAAQERKEEEENDNDNNEEEEES